MIRESFEAQLKSLEEDLLKMGSMTEEALRSSICLLYTSDAADE